LFVVLTAPGAGLDVEAWNAGAAKRLKAFVRALRASYGKLQYFATWELQKRGALHVNIFLLSDQQSSHLFIPHEVLKRVAVRAGFGTSTWVEPASKARVRYAAKKGYGGLIGYITKDVRMRHLNGHAYSFSRGWLPAGVRVKRQRDPDGTVWVFESSEQGARKAMREAGYLDPPGYCGQSRGPPEIDREGGYRDAV
jgi:hypothetical protein